MADELFVLCYSNFIGKDDSMFKRIKKVVHSIKNYINFDEAISSAFEDYAKGVRNAKRSKKNS